MPQKQQSVNGSQPFATLFTRAKSHSYCQGVYTDRVPYLGFVEWDEDRIYAYAVELAATHRPRQWPRRNRCRACGTASPCFAAAWAGGLLRQEQRDRPATDAIIAVVGVLVGMAAFVALVLR